MEVAQATAPPQEEARPAIFYFHPWDMDVDQPRVADAPLKSKLRHYTNLSACAERLRRLLGMYRFGTVAEVLGDLKLLKVSSSPQPSVSVRG
mgnify:CR=1 FL=1